MSPYSVLNALNGDSVSPFSVYTKVSGCLKIVKMQKCTCVLYSKWIDYTHRKKGRSP